MDNPIARISQGRFASENDAHVKNLIDDSATVLVSAVSHQEPRWPATLSRAPDPIINVRTWEDFKRSRADGDPPRDARQRPILESAGVTFDRIADYEPLWK